MRLVICTSTLFIADPLKSTLRLVLGDFWHPLGQVGHNINIVNLVIYVGYILDRWLIYQQEESRHLYVLEAFAGDSRHNALSHLNRMDRSNLIKVINIVTKVTSYSFYIIEAICCMPLVVLGYIYCNYLKSDWVFFLTSTIAFVLFIFGLTFGLATVFVSHGILALSVEYSAILAKSVKDDVVSILENMRRTDTQELDFQLNQMRRKFFHLAKEIRKQNVTVSLLLRNEILVLCPTLVVCIMFFIVDGEPLPRLLCMFGASEFTIVMMVSLTRVGRVYTAVASLYPPLNSVLVRLPSQIPINTRLQLERIIKEIGSPKIPSFTMSGTEAFTKETTLKFVIATISLCLLVLNTLFL